MRNRLHTRFRKRICDENNVSMQIDLFDNFSLSVYSYNVKKTHCVDR